MSEFVNNLIANLIFVFERLNWLGVIDILLVGLIFFAILMLMRGTQAMVLLRGAILLVALIGLLTSFEILPAFSWLIKTMFPAILLAIPVIFAPEIRHALERLGRAGFLQPSEFHSKQTLDIIGAVVTASSRLSDRQHGALIVIERRDSLKEFVQTGVLLDARVTPELLLQIFFPNTPLHDGAVIIDGSKIVAASCVMPLSASGVLTKSPERQMGLRHRAALGISEVSDAIALVVSEETGSISVVHSGRMIRRIDIDRLENILKAFFRPSQTQEGLMQYLSRILPTWNRTDGDNE